MAETPPVTNRHFESAREFLRFLLGDETSWPSGPTRWRFRGHGNADWPLLPTALREKTEWFLGSGAHRQGPRATYKEQAAAEYLVARTFFERMDAAGVAIPGDSQLHRSSQVAEWWKEWLDQIGRGEDTWPPHDLLSLFAIAQHYGMPTRLLDWTRNPLVAGYFAARGAIAEQRNENSAPNLCVWACSIDPLVKDRTPAKQWIEVVSAPTASNPNLAKQEGVFTLIHDPQRGEDGLQIVPFDEFYLKLVRPHLTDQKAVLCRLTLPRELAPELMRRLAEHRVGAATVFSGHEAAAEAVREMNGWDTSPDLSIDTLTWR